jgi:drug/metabolite transporter (DMT)-like permease
MSNKVWAHLGLLIVNLIYGANYVIAKGLMPDKIGPSGFIFIRVISAVVVFQLVRLAMKQEMIRDKKDIIRLIFCGLFGVAANQLMFFNGLSIGSPINASIIMVSSPILVLVLSAIILKERLTTVKIAGVIIGCTAAVLFILTNKSLGKGSSWIGDLMVFFNAMSYGLYLVLVKPLMKKYSPILVISMVFFFGSLFVIPFGWNQFIDVDWSIWTAGNYYALAFVVIGVTVLTYVLNLFALKYVSPTVTSSYIYFQPVISSLVAIVGFHYGMNENYADDFSLRKIILALCIFLGVYLVSRPNKTKLKETE